MEISVAPRLRARAAAAMIALVSEPGPKSEGGSAGGVRHDVHLTLDVSLTPDSITGTLSAEDGSARGFESWLGLAQAVASAAGSGAGAPIAGPALLGETTTRIDAAKPRGSE